jgi:hypothetical protein
MKLSEKSIKKISNRLFDWGFDIWEQNRSSWTKKQLVEFEATWKILKRMAKENAKQTKALELTKTWLEANIDEPPPEGIREDSENLLEKIEEELAE